MTEWDLQNPELIDEEIDSSEELTCCDIQCDGCGYQICHCICGCSED